MKRLIGLTVALVLAGCGTVGSIRYDFASDSFGDKRAALARACAARMQNHAFDPIRAKVELMKSPPDGPVPFAILTDTAAPSPDELRAIGLWAQAIEQCQGDARPLLDAIPVPPGATESEVEKLLSYITDAWIQNSRLRVTLYAGQMTYADYAGERVKIAEDALRTAERYAQDTDEANDGHDLEATESALEPFASMM